MTRIVLAFFVSIILAACNGGDGGDGAAGSGDLDTTRLAPGGTAGAAPDTAAIVDTSGPKVTHVAVIATDSGDVEVELFGEDAPKAVENFVGLARKNFYVGLAFHRVIPGFVAQTGDPQSKDSTLRDQWGTGGESLFGGTFDDELDTAKPSAKLGYREGVLAMANKGPNTNSSQFFIVLDDAASGMFEYRFTIFGRVRSGNDALRRIESTGFQGEMPLTPARITSITVREAGG